MVLRKSFYICWSAGRSPRVHEVNPGRDPSCCLCYSIFDLLIKQKHFFSGNPMTIYNFKTPITFTFNKMHLQNDAFIQYQCNVKILLQIHFSIPSFRCSVW